LAITIDVKAASARGVYVTNCGGKNSIAVAELVFALLLGLDRRIPDNVAALRAHKWNKKEFSKADGVYGKTLGIVGLGQIGCEVIKRAHAFGLHVMGTDASLNLQKARDLNVEYCSRPRYDVSPRRHHLPARRTLKPDTKKLVSADRIAMMKPNAILINTARGEVVDQTALQRRASEAKRIRAGLDVFDPEPAESHRRVRRPDPRPAEFLRHTTTSARPPNRPRKPSPRKPSASSRPTSKPAWSSTA
jgi:D-3-phosphoglycerate dehydrogenase / 2-oxoglutarate reductase